MTKRREVTDVDRLVEAFHKFNGVPVRKPDETTSPSESVTRSCKAGRCSQ